MLKYLSRRLLQLVPVMIGITLVTFLLMNVVGGAPVMHLIDERAAGIDGAAVGSDHTGRDLLSRLIFGARISLTVGLVVQGIALVIGTTFGLLAGYYGGWLDDPISGLTTILQAFPGLLFAIAVMATLGPGLFNVFMALGLLGWPTIARLVRGEVMALREREFVEGARSIGAKDLRILMWHVLPNCKGPIIVTVSLGMAVAILSEASLSFLGLGTQPPTPSWGAMLAGGRDYIWEAPWLTLYPGLAIFVTILGLNLLRSPAAPAPTARWNRSTCRTSCTPPWPGRT